LGIADHHHLCILIQVLVRFRPGSYRREYRPLQNPLPLLSANTPYEPFTWNPYLLRPPQTFYKPLHPLRAFLTRYKTPHLLRAFLTRCKTPSTRYKLLSTLYTPLQTVTRPLLPATSIPSTCHKLLLPVTDPFRSSTTFADALRYTIWQIYVGKSMMVRRSGARDLTLRLRMTLTTTSSSRPLNTHITSLQMTTCGNNTKKILQTLQKQFSRLVRASVTYRPFYTTKVYRL
jgi:hypothetical protein